MIATALPQPRPRTWAAVLRLAFDGDYTVPIPTPARWYMAKCGAINAILDRIGVDAVVSEVRLDIPEPIHPLIPPGPPELVVSFARRDGTELVPADIDAMLARATT